MTLHDLARSQPMVDDDDDDESGLSSHAADEPTAMWGAKDLEALGLDRPPSEPPIGSARPEAEPPGSESSVQISLGPADAPHQPIGKPRQELKRPGTMLPLLATFVGAVLLAVAAFYLVRAFR